jgi:4-hydroxythreonine-4-phosphate dehydrogenase
LLLTLGDVAGVGPEITVRAWRDPALHEMCRPVIVGDVARVRDTVRRLGWAIDVTGVATLTLPRPDAVPHHIVCWQATDQDLRDVPLGAVNATAGRAAYDFLCAAIDATLAGHADGIVTGPLHKEGLHAARIPYPGHTEILAARTNTERYAMMLYGDGIGVAHVTLHVALRDVFALLTSDAVFGKIALTDTVMRQLKGREPHIGVCALNPHASDGGLFGDEEQRVIAPAVERARAAGIKASGPWPSDTLFGRARGGEFDGVVAMYHDQGHIAMKLLAGLRAVNVTLGLPLVRTSVAHGTAYDIAPRFIADPTSLFEAVRVAARLAEAGGARPRLAAAAPGS